MTVIATFVVLVFAYSLVSARLERTVLTAPIVFTLAGMGVLLALPALRDRDLQGDREILLFAAEAGLVLLLFTDASRTDLRLLRSIRALPARLLSVGLLLTILLGALCARMFFPSLSIWEAGILAAILAPTDAGLGQIIVSSPRVPIRIRQALNVEAGLNDGLSVPFLLFFVALAEARASGGAAHLDHYVLAQLGYGTLVGAAVGLGGGWLMGLASRRASMAASFRQISVVVLPVACALVSNAVGASMFIAAFVAGLCVQVGFAEAGQHSLEFTENWGQVLNLSVFFLFGLLVARSWPQFTPVMLLYGVFSLTAARMLPVAAALIGTGLDAATVAFMGWFGPRGLASIVLGLVYLERNAHLPGETTIRLTVMVTVALSVFAHGLTAKPGIELYAARHAPGVAEHGAPEI